MYLTKMMYMYLITMMVSIITLYTQISIVVTYPFVTLNLIAIIIMMFIITTP